MTACIWVLREPDILPSIGLLLTFVDADDPRPIAEQFNERYAHGGGWKPQPKRRWRLEGASLVYDCGPDEPDEVYRPLAFTIHPITKELITVYDFGYVIIAQPGGDGDWDVARMD